MLWLSLLVIWSFATLWSASVVENILTLGNSDILNLIIIFYDPRVCLIVLCIIMA